MEDLIRNELETLFTRLTDITVENTDVNEIYILVYLQTQDGCDWFFKSGFFPFDVSIKEIKNYFKDMNDYE